MNSISLFNIENNKYNLHLQHPINAVKQKSAEPSFVTNHGFTNYDSFMRKASPNFGSYQIRTSLSGRDEHQKFNEISAILDKRVKKELNELLKKGKLLSTNSNDRSTTLDNLYKIATTPRASGLDAKNIIEDVIKTINKPYIITQKFGDIPAALQADIINEEKRQGKNITAHDLDVKSSTCPAASIEFDIAHRMPAEFARMAEGLTSENICVTKNINVDDLSQGLMNTIWMLNEFGTEHKMENWKTLKVNLKPDKNAIIRARIQNKYKDKDERSVIDVLMQSTFMNIGAQNTYDSLIDRRIPKYNDDDSGLIDIEKNFAEELATGKGKVCVTYQKIDDNGKLIGYECEQNETLEHIENTIKGGDNVIIGYTYCDSDNNVIGGHEITITGIEKDKKGNKYFVCNDTDDGVSEPITYPVAELLPKIHHAGIPKSVLIDNVEFVEAWKELMQVYKDTKSQQEVQNALQNNRLNVITPAA